MSSILTLALSMILLCLQSPASTLRDADKVVIDEFISSQATRERGEEYEDARKVVAGDLNHDGAPDAAVLYTIEGQDGSNNYVQYLAVFARVKGRLVHLTHTEVGGKSNRSVELEAISKNVILVKTLSYAAGDAACCPSKKGAARYALIKDRLKQI